MTAPGTVVIAGAGQGGFQVAASLREEKFAGRIVLVDGEGELPYQRPPLSKAWLQGKVSRDLLRLRPEKFYSEHRIELRAGLRVTGIERTAQRVALSSGEALAYDHLVLALGARNRPLPVPGADLPGVQYLRTLPESDALRAALEDAENIVVVGAGFIGLEIAAVARARGLGVTVVESLDRVMARAVTPEMSRFFQQAHESQGTRFLLGATVTRVLGEDRATGVETTDGQRLPAGCVVVGIGVIPEIELAVEAELDVANGIAVDAQLLTCDPAISAIGDCAHFPSPFTPEPVRLESVQNAVDQARCVAARLAGRPAPYAAVPWFWTDQGSLKLQIAGLTQPHDLTVRRGDPAQGGFSVFCYRAERLVGVESVNRPGDHIAARKLLARRRPLDPAQARDPGFDLKSHAAA